MRRHLLAALLVLLPLAAQAQERQFSVTLPESQWNTLARIISGANKPTHWTLEETMPIFQAIGGQMRGALEQDAANRQQALDAQKKAAAEIADLKAEVERLKAELEKAKNPEAPK